MAVDNDAMVFKVSNVNSQTKNGIEFIKCNLTPDREFPIVCNICDKEDHYYDKCPLVKREYKPLKEPTKKWLSYLEDVCRTVLHKHELTEENFQKRLKAVKYIEHHLRTTFSSKEVNDFYVRIYIIHLNREYQLNFTYAIREYFTQLK